MANAKDMIYVLETINAKKEEDQIFIKEIEDIVNNEGVHGLLFEQYDRLKKMYEKYFANSNK
ncbi:MAG: hypothetical protein AABX84_01885 [Nanoarchaeota archaeon]